MIDDELLNLLRYRSEGPDIDFKSAQYRLVGGSELEKSELLKDILAMANAWRDGTGYILLGFKEQRPHPAEVVGISDKIDDAQLQQFVHGKVKPKLTFSYEEHLYQGKTVGVISIPKQKRPFYIGHQYGKLKSNIAYVRRGSSTDEAEPPEIALMAQSDGAPRLGMRVNLSVLMSDGKELPDIVELRYLQFSGELPDYDTRPSDAGPFGSFVMRPLLMDRDNEDFWRECAEYLRVNLGCMRLTLVLRNDSESQLSNAKLEISIEPLEDQVIRALAEADLPDTPERKWFGPVMRRVHHSTLNQKLGAITIEKHGATPECHVRFGTLLPGEEARSETLSVALQRPGKLRFRFRILASELAMPIESERIVEASGEVEFLHFEDLEACIDSTPELQEKD